MKSIGSKVIVASIVVAAAGASAYFVVERRNNTRYVPPVQNQYLPNTPDKIEKDRVLINVPFTSQAPNAKWSDPRQQDGCEEAAILMAWLWINNDTMTKNEAEQAIIATAEYELKQYGNYHDTSAEDTAKLMREYYGHTKLEVKTNPTIDDIKSALSNGKVVLVPANGKRLNNPNFTNGGPETHFLVIKGFDEPKKQFITNDPGTRLGEGYVYDYQTLYDAMVNYPTGHHLSQEGRPKAMIVVSK